MDILNYVNNVQKIYGEVDKVVIFVNKKFNIYYKLKNYKKKFIKLKDVYI